MECLDNFIRLCKNVLFSATYGNNLLLKLIKLSKAGLVPLYKVFPYIHSKE